MYNRVVASGGGFLIRHTTPLPCWAPWWVEGYPVEYYDFVLMEPKNPPSPPSSPGHQGAQTGVKSVNENLRVLFTPFIGLESNYKICYDSAKVFGTIKRMKLKLCQNERFYNLYTTYVSASSASSAYEHLKEKDKDSSSSSSRHSRLLDVRNIEDEDGDFVPRLSRDKCVDPASRKMQIPIWHVVAYKEGESNLVKARDSLEDTVGLIPDGNLRRYGKGLLIKAANKSQASLLTSFRGDSNNIIDIVTPHKSFNTARGVIYSRDLYEFNEEDILSRCPENVLTVKKLKGINGAIGLTFYSSFLPDYVKISHLNFQVKKI